MRNPLSLPQRILLTGRQDAPSPSVGDADADRVVAAIVAHGGTVATAAQTALAALFVGLKDDGVWSSLDVICPLVGDQLTAAMVAYRVSDTSAFVMTNTNLVASDYAPGSGLTGDGLTKFVDTTVDIPTLSRTNLSVGVWVLADSSSAGAHGLIGSSYNATGDADRFYVVGNGDLAPGQVGLGYDYASLSTGTGLWLHAYDGAFHTAFRGAERQIDHPCGGLQWQKPGTVTLLKATGLFSDARIGFAALGTALTSPQVAALNARVAAYQTALERS